MYIYNVTINVEESVHEEWLDWMKKDHIPDMLNTGKFKNADLIRVNVQEPTGGITYAVHYKAESKAELEDYYENYAQQLRNEGSKFKDKVVVFRTELDVIAQF
ncbi:MAG: DUF4286 family protein [Psychroflexus sp.]|nr:DUF4286 family protein [Psychroflexus sp.]